jgi:hypothetical protein
MTIIWTLSRICSSVKCLLMMFRSLWLPASGAMAMVFCPDCFRCSRNRPVTFSALRDETENFPPALADHADQFFYARCVRYRRAHQAHLGAPFKGRFNPFLKFGLFVNPGWSVNITCRTEAACMAATSSHLQQGSCFQIPCPAW